MSVRLFSESFFYRFDLDTGAAKIHTCTHAHVRPHTCKYSGAKVACMLGNQVTPPPLLWALLLCPLLFPSYFYLFIYFQFVYSTNCFLSALKLDIYSAWCVQRIRAEPWRAFPPKLNSRAQGAQITRKGHKLWLANLGCLCFLAHVYDAGKRLWKKDERLILIFIHFTLDKRVFYGN